MPSQTTIAVVGGTGAEGGGLALRFAKAGATVRIGSRNLEKAQQAAREVSAATGSDKVSGHTNPDAAASAGVVVLTVPLAAQIDILKSIRGSLQQGAILVDATVPLEIAVGGRLSRMLTLWDGSAAQQAARLAPPGISVVAGFHALSAEALSHLDQPVECDTLICGDSAEAKAVVREVAELIPGVKVVDAGALDSARLLENAAGLLIALNLRYKVKHSGMRITGLPTESGHA